MISRIGNSPTERLADTTSAPYYSRGARQIYAIRRGRLNDLQDEKKRRPPKAAGDDSYNASGADFP